MKLNFQTDNLNYKPQPFRKSIIETSFLSFEKKRQSCSQFGQVVNSRWKGELQWRISIFAIWARQPVQFWRLVTDLPIIYMGSFASH